MQKKSQAGTIKQKTLSMHSVNSKAQSPGEDDVSSQQRLLMRRCVAPYTGPRMASSPVVSRTQKFYERMS